MMQQDEIISVSSSFSSSDSTDSYDIIHWAHIQTNLIYIVVLIYYKHCYLHDSRINNLTTKYNDD